MSVDRGLNRSPEMTGEPPRYRSKAFRAIETVLREDPWLAQNVKSWRSRQGWDDDLNPPAIDEMPLISLSPIPRPNALDFIEGIKINFAVSVQIFVPGSCFEDIDLVWERVEDAIVKIKPFHPDVPGERTVQEYLCRAISPAPSGVMTLYAQEPAFYGLDLRRVDDATRSYQWGLGTLSAYISRPA